MNDFDYFKKEHINLNANLAFQNKSIEDHKDDITAILNGDYINPINSGIKSLDPHFNMFWGMLLLVTGFPQSGKSELVNFLLSIHVCEKRGKVNIFSPESDTPILMTEITNTIKNLLNCSWSNAQQYVIEWITFKEIQDSKGMPDIKDLIEDYELLSKDGYNMFIIDPMNWVTSSMYTNTGSFESLRLTLTAMKQFARKTKSIMIYVEHPKTPQPNKDGEYPKCSIFSVNGGTMHNNKVDGCLILHRQRQENMHGIAKSTESDPVICEVAKLKMQKYLGRPNSITLEYDFKTGIYR